MSFQSGVLTHFEIIVSYSVIKNQPVSVVVTALDAFNNPVTDYTGGVTFSSSDINAVLPADYTFTTGVGGDDGTHIFTVIFMTTCLQTLTVRDIISSVSTTTPSISVYYSSTLSFTASPNPAFVGQIITLNAQVETQPSTSGTVSFYDETTGRLLGSGVIYTNNAGVGSLSIPITLFSGNHVIKVTYTGGSNNMINPSCNNFNASSNGLIMQVVNKYNSQVLLNVSPNNNTIVYGRSFGLNVVVTTVASESDVPSGTVTFMSGPRQLGIATLDSYGSAGIAVMDLLAGRNMITAIYSGDNTFNGRSTFITQNILKANTKIDLTKNPQIGNVNEPTIFTTSIIAPGLNAPTGSVIFAFDNNTQLVTTLDETGTTYISYTFTKRGRHHVRASYVGDSNYEPSHAYIIHHIN